MRVKQKRRARKNSASESDTKKPIQKSQPKSICTRVFSSQKIGVMPHNFVRLLPF